MIDGARRPLVLVTGGAGRVASRLRPYLRRCYRLRLVDLRPPDVQGPDDVGGPGDAPAADDEVVVGDLLTGGVAAEAMDGVHALVHLAGNASPGAGWADLQQANVALTQHLLDAAVRTGVERVVLASSIHAAGQYVRSRQFPVDPSWPPAPCCLYGASKVVIEALGSVYSHRHGLAVACLRIGAARERPHDAWALRTWSSPRDVAHLVDRSIAVPTSSAAGSAPAWSGFGVYYAVSANSRGIFVTTNARDDLGYRPVDDAERFRADQAGGRPPCFGPAPT